jgi:hypothetical protein
MQVSCANEFDDVNVRNSARLAYALIGSQKLPAAAAIADQKFSIDQFVPGNLVESQESLQLGCVRRRLARNRIQTDVSTRTIKPLCVWWTACHDASARPVHEARCREEPASARKRHVALAPRAQPDGVRIGGGAASCLGLIEEFIIDIQCLLHTYDSAINVWLYLPDEFEVDNYQPSFHTWV